MLKRIRKNYKCIEKWNNSADKLTGILAMKWIINTVLLNRKENKEKQAENDKQGN
jgi:preprotein translocase subunit SecG